MTEFVPIALYGWIPLVVALFAGLPARWAVITSFIGAWLFLPQAAIPFEGLPDLSKVTATSFGVLAGVALFDAGRFLQYRLSWVDIPMIVWCVVPFVSSVTNKLGPDGGYYDGISAVLDNAANWGIPYFIGRIYFNDLSALRDLAIGIMIGALIYVPLCLIEVRLSPQLHRWVYGFHQHSFLQTIRFGGYRPMVFMQHGLMVAMWMISGTLICLWLWTSGSLKRFWGAPMSLIFLILLVMCVLTRSAGAVALLVIGAGVLAMLYYRPSRTLLVLLVLSVPFYLSLRATNTWDGRQFIVLVEEVYEERADSLSSRFENEVLLLEKAFQKPVFGWGGWGRWRIHDPWGKDITVADSLWIIALGQTGLVGLVSLFTALLLPPLLLLRRIPIRRWLHPSIGGASALAVLLILYTIDSLLNAMLNPAFVLAAGGLSGFYVIAPRLRAQAARAAAAIAQYRQQLVRAREEEEAIAEGVASEG